MEALFNRSWYACVERQDNNTVLLETNYIDTYREVAACLWLTSTDFRVEKAQIETFRAPDPSQRGLVELPGLRGTNAFLGSARNFSKGIGEDHEGYRLEVFLEGVRILIQAAAFLVKDQGLTSEEYTRQTVANFGGSCYYFSQVDPAGMEHAERIEKTFSRTRKLFTRHRSSTLYRTTDGFEARVNFCDSYHEMAVTLQISKDLVITSAWADILRTTVPVCSSASHTFPRLRGQLLMSGKRQDYHRLVAGPQGCTHLADMTFEAARTMELYALSGGVK